MTDKTKSRIQGYWEDGEPTELKPKLTAMDLVADNPQHQAIMKAYEKEATDIMQSIIAFENKTVKRDNNGLSKIEIKKIEFERSNLDHVQVNFYLREV